MSDYNESPFILYKVNFSDRTALVSTGSAETNTVLMYDNHELAGEISTILKHLKLIAACHIGLLQVQDLCELGFEIDIDNRIGSPYPVTLNHAGRHFYPKVLISETFTERTLNNIETDLSVLQVSVESAKMTISAELCVGYSLVEGSELNRNIASKGAKIKFPPINLTENEKGVFTVWKFELNKLWENLKVIMMQVFIAHARKIAQDKAVVQYSLFGSDSTNDNQYGMDLESATEDEGNGESANDDTIGPQHEQQ